MALTATAEWYVKKAVIGEYRDAHSHAHSNHFERVSEYTEGYERK